MSKLESAIRTELQILMNMAPILTRQLMRRAAELDNFNETTFTAWTEALCDARSVSDKIDLLNRLLSYLDG